ncbi:MAG: hypothetical protein IPO19_09430 [Rhodoferax sp.]|nr:hypothetical protein [Rhodoferax sp.]
MDRILLLDRVSQRYHPPLRDQFAALDAAHPESCNGVGRSKSVSNNPFRPQVLVRAFMSAWEKGGFDDQATEDLINSLERTLY